MGSNSEFEKVDTALAKDAIDSMIAKARVHFYKPIQIAEILYRDRVQGDIDLDNLETYRKTSKVWRDVICSRFIGRVCNSSAKYQDDIFSETAMPPHLLSILGSENRAKNGVVEAYIYRKFSERFTQLSSGLMYCKTHDKTNFVLQEFIDLFWYEAGLRRSIDKIYEIIVYSLFSALVEALDITIEVSMNPAKSNILQEFEEFSKKVIGISSVEQVVRVPARINRVGVTNAADRGLDMYANFGLAIQIKHLSFTEELAEGIATTITADRIVIVCKDGEQKLILSFLNQLGWKSRIQSIITENDLIEWYEKALRGTYADVIGEKLIQYITEEIETEFPATDNSDFTQFYNERGYDKVKDEDWTAVLEQD